ncbi:hypothetical protein HJO_15993 [Hyphomonas johnsonii MHS-2]|uniref:Sulfotransferase n=2 Tax=Hyphomonas johnsonii TaxID=81031 RepID=A0A059FCN2_9PROT|nr:hypothetical protein HJO_15993 [Hyphomonas johnsonii MHS-2]
MHAQIIGASGDILVLSSEYIYMQPEYFQTQLYKYLTKISDDISVHAWIRDPVTYYRSARAQMLQAVGNDSDRMPLMPEKASLNHPRRVQRLRKVWGAQSVQLHPYNKSLMTDGNSVSDFFAKALPEAAGLYLRQVQSNLRPTDPLTDEEERIVRDACKDDYEFLAKEGLEI